MNFAWIYGYSTPVILGAFAALFVGVCLLGMVFVRPMLRRALRCTTDGNDLLNAILSCFCVFYGLLLSLIAMAGYQNFGDTEQTANHEASRLAGLYRDFRMYPEPHATHLETLLFRLLVGIIDEEWPEQQRGNIPLCGQPRVEAVAMVLMRFEPADAREGIIHAECLRNWSEYLGCRRARLFGVTTSIPGALWYVVVLGAALNMILLWMYDAPARLLAVGGGLLSLYVGTVIGLIVVMDCPFRGDFSVSAEPFKMLRDACPTPGSARPYRLQTQESSPVAANSAAPTSQPSAPPVLPQPAMASLPGRKSAAPQRLPAPATNR